MLFRSISGMVATLTASLPDTCTLVVDTLAYDGAGGQVATPGTPVSVACRVAPLRLTRSSKDAEVVQSGRVVEESLWIITLPSGTTVNPQYRVTHGAQTFEVVEALAPRSWEIDVRVSSKLINSGAG